jgi:hypothetical protein
LEPSQAGSRLDRVVDALRPNLRDQEVLERIASRLRSVLGELEGGGSAP